MKILVFSLGVVFKNAVQGGSQKVLRDISLGLAHRGHKITIVCPTREDNHEIFEICHGAIVKPILPLRGAFPSPYAVSPFALTETCRLLEEELKNADLLYCHDGGLLVEFIKNRLPTVISLRDFCYQETLLGALSFQGEAVIVNSMHTYLCLQDTFMEVNSSLKGKIKIIYNGYEPELFCRKEIPEQFYKKYKLPPKKDEIIIGFPHRPEMPKGFGHALQVLKQLTDTWGNRVKLLIPMYMDRGLSERTDDTYNQINTAIQNLHIQDNIIFHNWVCHDEMPEYYSYCDVILCIGNFVESFSNVSVESLLCGTPVVSTNASTYRTMPIRQFLNIVPYGAIDETTHMINEILDGKYSDLLPEARAFISKELTTEKMVDAYEQAFLQAFNEKKTQAKTKVCEEYLINQSAEDHYKLSAWCDAVDGKIYNDYLGDFVEDPFKGIFSAPGARHTKEDLIIRGIKEDDIEKAVTEGILVTCGENL